MKNIYLFNNDYEKHLRALTYAQGLDFAYTLKMKRKQMYFYNLFKQIFIYST